LLVGPVMNVHQTKVEILTVMPAMRRFVEILEPIGADDVGNLQHRGQGVAESGRPLLLPIHDGINATRILVAAAIDPGTYVEFANGQRFSCQSMQRLEVKSRKGAVAPTRVEVAGNSVDVTPARPHHFRIIK